MKREELYYILFEQQKDFHKEEKFVERELTDKLLSFIRLKLPIIITGLRRVGKSTLLKILKKQFRLKEKECVYIDFNDERFVNFNVEDFQRIIDFLNEQDYSKKCYFFLDEIQEVDKWEKWINRIKDKYQIFITGSNSKLLSKEISTVLTGRSINLSLYPFSFREFLKSKRVEIDKFKIDLNLQAKLRKEFLEFLNFGGIPKAVVENDKRILKELYENIIYRDIIKRFASSLEKPIKEISVYLLSNISKELSIRSLSKTIKIKNLSTLKSILDAFEKAFLFFFINKFDFSIKKQIQNPRKVYCVDNGFIVNAGFRFFDDRGKMLENLVFIELKRRNKEIYYFYEKKECDFVIREGVKIKEAIQVCYELNDDNKKREIDGLLGALEKFKLRQGLILTYSQEDEIKIGGNIIIIKPVWKWLLE